MKQESNSPIKQKCPLRLNTGPYPVCCSNAGCELVRVTTPTLMEAECVGEIRAKVIERYQEVHHPGSP